MQPGCLSVAIPGAGVDDCSLMTEALKGGAVAIVSEQPAEELNDLLWGKVTYVQVQDALAAWFHLRDSWGWLCRIAAVPG